MLESDFLVLPLSLPGYWSLVSDFIADQQLLGAL